MDSFGEQAALAQWPSLKLQAFVSARTRKEDRLFESPCSSNESLRNVGPLSCASPEKRHQRGMLNYSHAKPFSSALWCVLFLAVLAAAPAKAADPCPISADEIATAPMSFRATNSSS